MDQKCWEIIGCGNEKACPARFSSDQACWEIMEKHGSFQCQYGVCEECIVYLSTTNSLLFTPGELEEVMRKRFI